MAARDVLYYTAICQRCDMVMPFRSQGERDEWATGHTGATGHPVTFASEWRSPTIGEPMPPVPLVDEPNGHKDTHPQPAADEPSAVYRFLMLGGPLHGQERELPSNATQYFDTATAQIYRPLGFVAGQKHPLFPEQMVNTSTRVAFVHESMVNNQAAGMSMLADAVVGAWIRADNPQVSPEQKEPS